MKNVSEKESLQFRVVGDFRVRSQHYLIIRCEDEFNDQDDFDKQSLITDRIKYTEPQPIVLYTDERSVIHSPALASHPVATRSESVKSLLPREKQIVQLVAQGYSNKQIARHLSISTSTVATHLRRIFTKLNVDSRAAMVYRYVALVG